MKKSKGRILIIDDERTLCETMSEILAEEEYSTEVTFDGKSAIEKITKQHFDVIFCDLRLPEKDGIQVLKYAMDIHPEIYFIVMTAYGSMETTLEALKSGAYDYVIKPLVFDEIILKLKHLIDYKELRSENRILRDQIIEQFTLDNLLGQGTEMRSIFSIVQRVAPSSNIILITGETGVGKEKLGKAIHYQSPQKGKKFIKIHCSTYPISDFEKQLFGEDGIFIRGQKGTLYLEEISDLTANLQLKLLHQLMEWETKHRYILRLIISSTKDLAKEVSTGRFLEELLYRINAIEIKVPPLRARKNDIPFLIKFYVRMFSEQLGKKVRYVTDDALYILMNYSWMANIRELANLLERAILLCSPETDYLEVSHFPTELRTSVLLQSKCEYKMTMKQHEQQLIQRILEKNEFDKKKTANELGMSLSSLYRKLEELSIGQLNG